MQNYNNKTQLKPLFHGVVLVAGGAVGAGMFALPLVASGAWLLWSLIAMVVVWWFTYLAANLLAQVNFAFTDDNSFDTIVKSILGSRWAALNNLSIGFIMYILMYAYISAGGGILDASLGDSIELPKALLSLVFALIVAVIVCLNTTFVSRLSTVLMVAMGLSFISANSGLMLSVDFASLFNKAQVDHIGFVAYALPVYVTAFACAGLVPSLVSHYRNQSNNVIKSLRYGSLLTLLIYIVWLLLTLGNIEREGFIEVGRNGGGIDALIGALQSRVANVSLQSALSWFSHLAIITSFLSIAVGLVHFLQDRFQLGQGMKGRIFAVIMAFLPPTIFSVVSVYGFVSAIGYAGLLVAFSFFIIPALLYAKQETDTKGKLLKWLSVLLFGVLVMLLKLASLASMLPRFAV